MTTPGSHNDAFASSHHRHFWGNYAGGLPADQCAESSEKVHDASDAFTFPIPVFISGIEADNLNFDEVKKQALSVNGLFRKSPSLDTWIEHFLVLLDQVLTREKPLREAVLEAAKKISFDVETSVQLANEKAGDIEDFSKYLGGDGTDPMAPCPPEKNFPALLHFVLRYPDPVQALLASANAGGDNVPRNAALGALFGAEFGLSVFPESLRKGLYHGNEIEKEISDLLGETSSTTKAEL